MYSFLNRPKTTHALIKMKSITTKTEITKRPEGSKVTSILSNMFGGGSGGSKRVLAQAEEENNNKTTTRTTVSDIIAMDKNNNKKNTCISSRGNKFLSHVFRKKFVIDGARKTSRLSLLRRVISAKRRATKKEEEGANDQVVVVDELCKRRILMGMKCKPVNASGKLHYGQDGVILHEE